MTYEIKMVQVEKNGRTISKSVLASEVKMATKDGLNALKALPEGKTRYTWFSIPNDYQMEKYIDKFEITVTETTTGKNVYKITK